MSKRPTLANFAQNRFLPFAQQTFEAKPKTLEYYKTGVKALLSTPHLRDQPLDHITAEMIAEYAAAKRDGGLAISSVNRHYKFPVDFFVWLKNGTMNSA